MSFLLGVLVMMGIAAFYLISAVCFINLIMDWLDTNG